MSIKYRIIKQVPECSSSYSCKYSCLKMSVVSPSATKLLFLSSYPMKFMFQIEHKVFLSDQFQLSFDFFQGILCWERCKSITTGNTCITIVVAFFSFLERDSITYLSWLIPHIFHIILKRPVSLMNFA